MMSRAAWGRLSEADRKLFRKRLPKQALLKEKLWLSLDEKLVAEFKKMPNIQMNSVDTAVQKGHGGGGTSGRRSPRRFRPHASRRTGITVVRECTNASALVHPA